MSHETPSMPSVSPVLFYEDLGAAAAWLCTHAGFIERMEDRITDEYGVVHHAELLLGDGLVILSRSYEAFAAPGAGRAPTATTYVLAADVDAHHDATVAGGATVTTALRDTDYGARVYAIVDPFGQHWIFAQARA